MLAPRIRLTVLLAVSGCFVDNGVGTTAGSSTSAASTSSGTEDAPPPSTTAGDTTTAPDATTTSDTTSGSPQGLECVTAPCFNVINGCLGPLWIHAANNEVVLGPDNVILAAGASQQFAVPAEWPAGRVNAYWLEPDANPEAHDKVEVTVLDGSMNYSITYVDYVGLPVEMVAVGPECSTTPDFEPTIGCYVAREELLKGCPDELRSDDRCLSASVYCADPAHKDLPYCHALDDRIAECVDKNPETCGVAGTLGDSTPNVYACSGYFDSQPPNCTPAGPDCHLEGNKWCAALNRGMVTDPDSSDSAAYYQTAPFNTYAKWVHDTCPGIHAFPYDDYPSNISQSGSRACKADRLDITFCPVG